MAQEKPTLARLTDAEYAALIVSRSRPLSAAKAEKIAVWMPPVGGAVK